MSPASINIPVLHSSISSMIIFLSQSSLLPQCPWFRPSLIIRVSPFMTFGKMIASFIRLVRISVIEPVIFESLRDRIPLHYISMALLQHLLHRLPLRGILISHPAIHITINYDWADFAWAPASLKNFRANPRLLPSLRPALPLIYTSSPCFNASNKNQNIICRPDLVRNLQLPGQAFFTLCCSKIIGEIGKAINRLGHNLFHIIHITSHYLLILVHKVFLLLACVG